MGHHETTATDRHNRYILVVIDAFMNWVEAFSLLNTLATLSGE